MENFKNTRPRWADVWARYAVIEMTFHIGYPVVRTDEWTDVRSRDYQIFLDAQITKFYNP